MSDDKKSVIEIVTDRMERFFANPCSYDGPFSGITYGEVRGKKESRYPVVTFTSDESVIDPKDLL